MGKLDGRVVLITGAARGQGAQEARLFAAEGARVVLADVRDDDGQRLAEEIGSAARYVHLDVGEEAGWAEALAFTKRTFGKLDGLVNNAGIAPRCALTQTSPAMYEEVVRINQTGPFLGMRAAAPELAAAGGGTIVNTASYAALSGLPSLVAYAATKAAVVAMTRVAALELAGQGIRVNALCPGGVDTPMTNPGGKLTREEMDAYFGKLVPLGRVGRPEEMARVALFLSCDDSSYVTGQPFVVDGGWLAGTPLPPA
ncbi:glucose 1-dehydrogenase [Streptomyces sp. SCA3-4]|uniref:SDR family NAD(P)-dependent oxidoreductase n=1 Tax=Streptomyces sichuanensis TaxID=2871810 RepID=UPI001CE2F7B7|nr:glucose 1-dehydrogenase [Streptomyces sichuanensis]MCA6096001.1 glucose 1-dehydrogenase [Streptomyces sichuanensis]